MSELVGRWRIEASDAWDQDALDLVQPAYIEFDADGGGSFALVAVQGDLDARFDSKRLVEFSWEGFDELDPSCGRGRAELHDDGLLTGHIHFHHGDDSSFTATRQERP